MTPTQAPSSPVPARQQQQDALTCYMSAILAIAKSMQQVCPQAGLVFSNRLERLPRRLGFDATPKALADTREALEIDLAEYTKAAGAWTQGGADLARAILANISTITESLGHEDELHSAMVEGLAEQMEISGEVDDEAQLRPALKRYAAGLRAYIQRREKERTPVLTDLLTRATELNEWLSGARTDESIDELTGLLNRHEAERQLKAALTRGKPFCVPVFQWAEAHSIPAQLGRAGADQILKEFAERLVHLVRPRDIVCRWSEDKLAVIFDCRSEEARDRAAKIAQWISDKYSIVVGEKVRGVDARALSAVIEPVAGEGVEELIQQIDAAIKGTPAGQVA